MVQWESKQGQRKTRVIFILEFNLKFVILQLDMNTYELALMLPGETSTAKQKSFVDKLEKLVDVLKGELGKVNDLGKVDLAYKIGKETTGLFLVYPLKLEGNKAKALDEKLRLEGDLLRYLLIRKEK